MKKGQLKVWWIPQVPGKAFEVLVNNLREAKLLMDTLANYDLFQFRENVKPDYTNAGGVQIFENDEWTDWYDEETGMDFDEYMEDQCPSENMSE